ncbi:ribonuclease HII [Candidatus Gracilibacteria bacterium]|nr:ribonuclease HII [Candidatus Gracilibacteria bacterium]MCF7898801.1 ribonuclease HII [Candidatus Paceibacterota bacterium]
MKYIIGIDEVGRGPIAGPVVVCACAIMEGTELLSLFPNNKLKDSKKLTEKNREKIRSKLNILNSEKKVVWGVGEVSARRIDEIGISLSIKEAMNDALLKLEDIGVSTKSKVVLDGSLFAPERYINQETFIKGDEKFVEISLASIIAKVYRDNLMTDISKKFSMYGFENHVGYGTKAHYEAISKYGMTTQHRKSFLKKLQ